ncbi:hypothetical protein ASG40_13035 [Methylobacterium sp. Leaf399]|uniref:phage tail protein n=1 Tax=unclassified Methylobacterium TaxID=2615210 RepID=UPI0006FFED13|nr:MULTISPECIES: tail fiber protein [unclassified Methylobacterium]KQP50845.1 hypothetical protein ASF39_11415 [Methylobacterium sp. Leaf108]KQT07826.1 hypothetical protein ASG40_13035 [Methylobacterium sp. Leaf399]KQT88941.1 hypothetical protein ASG59_13805 [Methylobacterium sp. Leaf466]
MTGLWDFSIDATSNDLAAPPINWQEGQAAGSVNASAREMMGALARWHLDTVGVSVAFRGANNAYAMSTFQGATAASLLRGFTLAFSVDVPNDGPATLSIDGVAKPLRRQGGVELAPGDLAPNIMYRIARSPYSEAYFVLTPGFEPSGRISPFGAYAAIPLGWIICDGAALSRTAYASLFAVIGTTYGAGDGTTTFNVPNLNGRAMFGPGLSGAGGLGGAVGSAGGSETVALSVAQLPSHNHNGSSTTGAGGHDHGGATQSGGEHNHGGATQNAGTHDHTASTTTDGAHPHTGTTGAPGTSHAHSVPVEGVNFALGNGTNLTFGVRAGAGSQFIPTSTDSPAHGHDVTIGASGGHGHGVQVNNGGDHAHGIPGSGTHAHVITAVGDHAHGVNVAAAGENAAHPNMPPGLVVVFAIKA